MLSEDLSVLAVAVSMILESESFVDASGQVRVRRAAFEILLDRISGAAAEAVRLEVLASISPIQKNDCGHPAGNVVTLDDFRKPKGDAA